jgi:hypothetical protein
MADGASYRILGTGLTGPVTALCQESWDQKRIQEFKNSRSQEEPNISRRTPRRTILEFLNS